MSSTNAGPSIRQRRLARLLKDLRIAAGLKHADAARVLDSAESKMTRIENAKSGIRLVDLRTLLDAYGVTDPAERAQIEQLAKDARKKGWWAQYAGSVSPSYAAYIAVEWDAVEMYDVEPILIPGLLQVPAYTKALARIHVPSAGEGLLETRAQIRQDRRKTLTRDDPLQLWAIVSESALYHAVGGADVMREQLESLLTDSDLPNVELQILPKESPMNAALFGPFVIMSFSPSSAEDLVYGELNNGTVYYEEPGDTERFAALFRRLNMAALDPPKSRALIRRVLNEMAGE
ncbi:helix-turn-helix domain-containing protein [Streptomyces sp. NPDC001054]